MISGLSVPFLTRDLLKHSIRFSFRSISNERQLENFRSHLSRHKKLSAEKKDLILTILHSTATKREVRNYLSKYPLLKGNDIYENPTKLLGKLSEQDIARETITGHDTDEHLNAIRNQKYDRLIDDLLTKYSDGSDVSLDKSLTEFPQPNEIQLSDTLRIAFIKIANLNKLTVEITKGIGLTIYKMVQLGVSPVIVLDLDYKDHENKQLMIKTIMEYSNSLIHVLESEKKLQLRPVRGLFDYDEESKSFNFSVPELLTIPLLQGIIPILFPIATSSKSEEMIMDTFQVIQSTAQNLTSLNTKFKETNDSDLLSIEKIVYIDPIGGLPSLERFQSSHVYIFR